MVEDPHPTRQGFVTRSYARVVVEMTPGAPGWGWSLRDGSGRTIASGTAYPDEHAAEQGAASALGGIWIPVNE